MNDCPSDEVLSGMLLGRLATDVCQKTRDHLEECPACQERVRQIDTTTGSSRLPSTIAANGGLSESEHEQNLQPDPGLTGDLNHGDGERDPRPGVQAAGGLESGNTIGEFEIRRQIGQGGMGVVFEAWQESLGRTVALKILPLASSLNQTQLARFEIEAHAAACVNHPHIVPVYAVGHDRGVHYYAMKLVTGTDLGLLIRRINRRRFEVDAQRTGSTVEQLQGSFSPRLSSSSLETIRSTVTHCAASAGIEELRAVGVSNERDYIRWVASVGIQAAEALNAAHEQGIVHRDVKPSNLMVEQDGHLWVMDFGLARVESDATMTGPGDVLGTVRYSSPEQALGKRGLVDHRTDIYSLGATLYELLTGVSPFGDDSRETLLLRLAGEDPRDPRRLNPAIPRDLETVLLKCLSRRIDARYATAQDLADDLRRFQENRAVHAIRPSLLNRMKKWVQRNRAVSSTIVTVTCALITLTAGLFLYNRRLGELNTQLADSNTSLSDINVSLTAALGSLEQQEAYSRQLLYAADIQLAVKSLQEQDPRQAIELLNRHVPDDSETDLRRLEWYHLQRRAAGANALLADYDGASYVVTWSADGRWLATAGEEGLVRILDTATLEQTATLEPQQGELNGLAFSPDNSLLATVGDDGTGKVWDRETRRQVTGFEAFPDEVYGILFTADGQRVITTGRDPVIRIWHTQTGELTGELTGHTDAAGAIAMSQDGRSVVSAGVDGTVRLWDPDSLTERAVFDSSEFSGTQTRLTCIALTRDGRYFATGGYDRKVSVCEVSTGRLMYVASHLDVLTSVSFSADGTLMVSSDRGGNIHLRTLPPLPSGSAPLEIEPDRVLGGHDGRAYCVQFSPDGRRLASAGSDGRVNLWTLEQASAWEPVPGLATTGQSIDTSLQSSRYFGLDESGITIVDTDSGSVRTRRITCSRGASRRTPDCRSLRNWTNHCV